MICNKLFSKKIHFSAVPNPSLNLTIESFPRKNFHINLWTVKKTRNQVVIISHKTHHAPAECLCLKNHQSSNEPTSPQRSAINRIVRKPHETVEKLTIKFTKRPLEPQNGMLGVLHNQNRDNSKTRTHTRLSHLRTCVRLWSVSNVNTNPAAPHRHKGTQDNVFLGNTSCNIPSLSPSFPILSWCFVLSKNKRRNEEKTPARAFSCKMLNKGEWISFIRCPVFGIHW